MCFVQLNAQNTTDYIPTGLISNDINAPGRMAVDTDDNVYVTDAIQNNIVKYDIQGNYLTTITTDFNPISIAINKNDRLFAGDKETGNIYKVSQNGKKSLFYSGLTLPNSMVFGLDILYITDSEQKKVIGLDVSGNVVTDFTHNTFTFPTGIAFDKQNNHLIVSEHGGVGEDVQTCGGGSLSWGTTGPLTTIYIFDLAGGLINNFGCFGTNDGLFQRIQGITVGACGNIYAADPYLGRVNVFDPTGNYITKFGTQGDNLGNFNLPVDIVFTSDNRAFVSSMNKGAIDVFAITQTLPTATITSTDQTVCSLSDALIEVQLSGTAPWTFNYTIDGQIQTEITTSSNPYTISTPVTGLYEVSDLTDDTGTLGTCLTGAAYIRESIPPTATILTTELPKCSTDDSGIEIQFTGIAPFTFTYTVDGLNPTEITTINNPYTLKAEQSGFYEITALSDDGCSGTEIIGSAIATLHPLPSASFTSDDDGLFINPGEIVEIGISFTGTAPYTFSYYKDSNKTEVISITTSDNPYMFTVSDEDTYQISSIADLNCSNNEWQDYFDIVYDGVVPPTATITTEIIEICEENSDNITVDFTGVSPWTFSYTVNGLNPVEINTSSNPYVLEASVPGIYELNAVSDFNNAPGSFSGTAQVTELSPPIVDIGHDIHMCEGDPVYTIDAGEFESYLWNTGSTNRTLKVSAPGTYSVTVTNTSGCSGTDFVTVSVSELPRVDLGPDIQMCNGDDAITIDAGEFESYLWNTGSTNQTLEVNSPGTYSVTVTNTSGCSAIDFVAVSLSTLPIVDLGSDIQMCQGDGVYTIDAGEFESYLWNTGSTNRTIEVSSPGIYNVTVTNTSGCSATDFVTVSVSTLPIVDLGSDIQMCQGDGVYTIDAGEFESYLWNTGSTNRTIEVSSPGTYSVTVKNISGCSTTDFVSVSVNELPIVDLGSDIYISEGDGPHTIDAGEFESYLWNTGSTNRTIEVNSPGTYSVIVTNTSGCSATGFVTVIVSEEPLNVVSRKEKDLVVIYPNPSYGEFTLKITPEQPITTDIEVLISGLSGKTAFYQVYNPYELIQYNGSLYIKIQLSNSTKSLYVVHINAENFEGREKLILKD